jgi:hypothetical protein
MQRPSAEKSASQRSIGSARGAAAPPAATSEWTTARRAVTAGAASRRRLCASALALACLLVAGCDGVLLEGSSGDAWAAPPDGQVFEDAGPRAAETERATDAIETVRPIEAVDAGLPLCPCFVSTAWCGASAARHALTLPTPCRLPFGAEHDRDLLACDAAGAWTVRQTCSLGCVEAPTGTPDSCVVAPAPTAPAPTAPGWAACPHRALLHSGLHPEASDRLRCAGVAAAQITQTIGDAPASAGYHAADGTADGHAYCAAVDLRARGLTDTQLRALLDRLGRNGFAAWYRRPGSDGWPASEAPHIHAVFSGVVMKSQLRAQVRDFLLGLNGLSSHTRYRFWVAPTLIKTIVRRAFSRHYTPP